MSVDGASSPLDKEVDKPVPMINAGEGVDGSLDI